jgi:hypothetical protein
MKTLTPISSAVIFCSILLLSCEDDPLNQEGGNNEKITVQFETGSREIAENAAEGTLVVKFHKPAVTDGVLTLKADNQFIQNFMTTPGVENGLIRIQFSRGDASAEIRLTPIDNALKDGNRLVNLTLHNLPVQFIAGVNNTINVMVKDDETTGPVVQSVANFIDQDIMLDEANPTGAVYQIHLSDPVAIDSEIKINLSSDNGVYNLHYVTEPAAENNVVTLQVTPGLSVIGFTVKPVANTDITGELKIEFLISQTSGSITKGNNLDQSIIIKDDELAQKPKGYEVTAANTIVKRFYEYDPFGRVSKVKWENYTPYLSHGTDTYYYDVNGLLVKINKAPGRDILYHWSNARIVKSEQVVDGKITNYTDFEYDGYGNIAGAGPHYLQPDGTFAKGIYTIYLYFLDGNLYKSLTYAPTKDPLEPYLLSTKTYDNYIDVANPFPMTEVLPLVKSQTKLATTYRVEENGTDLTYHMTYEYRPDGLPGKRIATTNGDTQTAVYHYY